MKYDTQGALRYQQRKASKHRAEMRLIDRALRLIPPSHHVLDVPCGGGRVALHLARRGHRVTAADLSEPMLGIAREALRREGFESPVNLQDVEQLTYPDRAFDTAICFRLFHHFPDPENRGRAVRELCRVADRFVALSYFSPLSPTSLRRILRARMSGRPMDPFPTSLREVKHYFAMAGFQLVKDLAQTPLLHSLHLAVFERATPPIP